MSQRILVVDDDRQIVRLVRSYLERAGFHVLVAYEGEAALHTIRHDRPDLVVLDLMLPERDGWEITRIIRSDKALAGMPIIMLTARVEDSDKIVGLELGADDYISKPFNPQEVVARVKAVLRRFVGAPLTAHVVQIGELILDLDQHNVAYRDSPADLTPSEFAILQLLMQNPERAFTRLELIDKGLGYAYEGLERTVDSHIKNIRKKTAIAPDHAGYIETVYGVGYRLVGEK